jgi:type IV pilus biogenesis protein PilP
VEPAPAAAQAPGQAEAVKAPGADINKSLETMEEKVSENAKSVVKRLDTASNAVMLDDLNNARQTVARIEAMIDIEKHMAELDKLRGARNGGGAAALAGAIPASALVPPSGAMPPAMPVANMAQQPRRPSGGSGEISRIVGTDGRYTAVIKLAGETKAVKVGDHISGATVRSISPSSVEIEENGETHTLHIKNVDTIYSAMR